MAETRRVRLTRQLLHRALVALMQDRPIHQITVKDICALADVNRSTFYDHYEDIFALLREVEADFLARIPMDYATGEGALIELKGFVRYVDENRPLYAALRRWPTGIEDKLTDAIWARYQAQVHQSAAVNPGLKRDTILYVIAGSCRLLDEWVAGRIPAPAEGMADTLMALALAALTGRTC